MALRLHTIVCSTRPGRVGPAVAEWFQGIAAEDPSFESILVDLAAVNLPMYDEPRHPALQQYEHEHTKRWGASVAAADAFVFVTPEYNYGPPPSLVNALNYVYKEWNYKPVGFVSYGGVSGGMRAVVTEKMTVTTLKMVPLVEAVVIPTVAQHLSAERKFVPNDLHIVSAKALLAELARWARALKPLRQAT